MPEVKKCGCFYISIDDCISATTCFTDYTVTDHQAESDYVLVIYFYSAVGMKTNKVHPSVLRYR